MHRSSSLVLLAVACLASAWSLIAVAAAPRRPNIVLILADDLGYTDVACYGSKYYETPHIDRLAAEGTRFTDGYACGPNCQPTRAALLSGQYGPRTGVYTVGDIDRFNWRSRPLRPVDNVVGLPLEKITLAQALRSAGYVTGMFGKWHLGNDAEHHPSRRGFDDAIASQGQHFDFATDPATEYPSGTYLADFLTDKAVDFIRRHAAAGAGGKPFFLYLPHFAVHGPHDAKANLIARFKDKKPVGGHGDPTYAAMIASVDESVGRIMVLVDELKLTKDTLIIFTSDNGGVGGYEREGIQGNSITDNAPLKGGKGMLYEGGIRVPYIFRMPGTIAPGANCDKPINSVDLYPTLLELAGAASPTGYTLDGTSYLALLRSESKAAVKRKPIFWHFPGYLGAGANTWRTTPGGAIRSGDWKLIEYFEDGRRELYDLKNDPGERRNLADASPQRFKALGAELAAWRASVGAKMPTPNEPDPNSNPDRENRKQRRRAQQAGNP